MSKSSSQSFDAVYMSAWCMLGMYMCAYFVCLICIAYTSRSSSPSKQTTKQINLPLKTLFRSVGYCFTHTHTPFEGGSLKSILFNISVFLFFFKYWVIKEKISKNIQLSCILKMRLKIVLENFIRAC